MANVLEKLKNEMETKARLNTITQQFNDYCTSPKPDSHGVCFQDVYLVDDWNEAEPSPENNCYVILPYKFKISASDFEGKYLSF